MSKNRMHYIHLVLLSLTLDCLFPLSIKVDCSLFLNFFCELFTNLRMLIIVSSIATCTPKNQSFHRQITSHEKDGAVSGVGQW